MGGKRRFSKDFDITPYIPVGSENAIPRDQLALDIGASDCLVRTYIEIAKLRGVPILNLGVEAPGYFIPTAKDVEKAERYYNSQRSRALSILTSNKELGKWIADVKRGLIK